MDTGTTGTGTITRVIEERGFGFIRRSDGDDLFFHVSDWCGDLTFDARLRELAVTYDIRPGRDGRPLAVSVRPAR